GFHPISDPIRPCSRRPSPRCLHHLVNHPAKEEGIGLFEVLGVVTMQLFVREDRTMIAAPIQCDVDGIPKRSHLARVSTMKSTNRGSMSGVRHFSISAPAVAIA